MKAVSTAASASRHTVLAVVEAILVVAVILAAAFAIAFLSGRPTAAGSALAANGGTREAWITLKQSTSAAAVHPSLGSEVAFATGYPTNVKNPRIEVLCYQGSDLVYGEAGSVDHTFQLGGASSAWLRAGGPAECTANLFYFGTHAGHQTYNRLASTTFSAGG
jgi:hypothetical protein